MVTTISLSAAHPQPLWLLAIALFVSASGLSHAQDSALPAEKITDPEINEEVNPDFAQITNDGRRALFLSTQNGAQELFSIAVSEGAAVRLNDNLVSGGNVANIDPLDRSVPPFKIANDSLRVAYVADQETDGVFELFLSNIAGGFVQRLNEELPIGGSIATTSSRTDFRFSNDSGWVVYVADQNEDDVFELFSVPINSGIAGTPIRLNSDFSNAGADVVEFQISFNSQQVVYLADQNNDETFELFSVPIGGGPAVRLSGDLTTLGDVDAFKINQLSDRVVYQADQNVFGDDELFSVSITGGTPVQLNGEFAISGAANSSDVIEFIISDNLNNVVFLADATTNDQFELFSVPILGGTPVRVSGNLVDGGDVRFGQFDFSNFEQNVVYVADQNVDGVFELFTAPLSGQTDEIQQLSPPNSNISSDPFVADLPDNIFTTGGLVISDGSASAYIVFLTDYTGTAGTLYSVPAIGGTPIRLDTVAPGDVRDNFQLDADDSQVLFVSSSAPGKLFRAPVNGGDALQLNNEASTPGNVISFARRPGRHLETTRVIYSATQANGNRTDLFSFGDLSAPASAVLPGSRSVMVGETATAFATMINTTNETLENCRVGRPPLLPFNANSFFQATDPSTNEVVGFANSPVDIAPGAVQTFLFGFIPNSAFEPIELIIPFDCSNTASATSVPGVNTLLFSGSDTPVADIIALGATPTADGILTLPGAAGAAAFAVASVNVGSTTTVVAIPDTGDATLPLSLFICETNPDDGQCLATPSVTVETSVASGATPTFSVFANASGDVFFDPANTRIRVRFLEAGAVRGTTSVAVRTQ